ncbi:MAG: hypothetical protein QM704_13335 [Anaeromyxobacteraceae bacterium]
MRSPSPLLLAAALLSFSSARADEPARVVKADAAHDQLSRKEGEGSKPFYRLSAGAAFDLDVSSLPVAVPRELAQAGVKGPNSVQVVFSGGAGDFSLDWRPGTSRLRVSGESLKTNPGSPRFETFRSGQSVVVAIGHLAPRTGSQGPVFTPMWVGMIQVD